MNDEVIPLHALRVEVSPALVGSKVAVQFGNGPVYVSPAMFDLMKNATESELELLLKSIHIRRLPPLPSLWCPPSLYVGEPSSANYAAAMLDLRAYMGKEKP